MIKGNGIDIIEIARIKNAIDKNKSFLKKIFSSSEREYIESRKGNINTIAGLFAAKEAVSKALGSGIRGFKWTDLEILHNELGKPEVMLKGKAKEIALRKGIEKMHLSISHNQESAIAYSIAEGTKAICDSSVDISGLSKQVKAHEKEFYNLIDNSMVKSLIRKRKKISHKGTYGRIGIIAGSLGMTGASFLASQATLRSGSGLVFTITPKSLSHIMEIKTTEIIVKPVEDEGRGYFTNSSLKEILETIDKMDAIALGPGIGIDDKRIKIVEEILQYSKIPIILDSDGINCIAKKPKTLIRRIGETIITPHPGEMARLLNISIDEVQSNRIKYAKKASERFGVITVLKGANTIVSDMSGNIYMNTTGNAGMATAGSGDVLTGIISSFIGQKFGVLNSALAGVYIHGLAGDLAANDKGQYGMISSDIIEKLPYAIKHIGG